MKTDIFMPLYVGDYLKDTMHLSRADHGAYLLLLMAYWNNQGPLPDDDDYLAGAAKCPQAEWPAVRRRLEPFFDVSSFALASAQPSPSLAPASAQARLADGRVWKHKRVDIELAKAQARHRLASAKGKAGAEAQARHRRGTGTAPASAQAEPNHSTSPSPSLSLERAGAARPSTSEVEYYAQLIGLAKWKAIDWLDEMEACGWLDYQHRPVADWKALLRRVKAKWEADGRPEGPPSRQNAPQGSTGTAEAIRMENELKRIEDRLQWLKGQASHTAFGAEYSPEHKKERSELLARKKEIIAKLDGKK